MFHDVLVPLDGSEPAEWAIPYAAKLAGLQGRLILVRAALAHRRPGTSEEQAEVAAVEDAESYLKRIAAQTEGACGRVEWHVYYGDAAEAVADEIRLRGADSVVMSTHGRSGAARLLRGSVAESVLKLARVPVLMIPNRGQTLWPQGGARIVLSLDGSDLAEGALPLAADLARRLNAELVLMTVIEPQLAYGRGFGYAGTGVQDLGGVEEAARKYLDEKAAALQRQGIAASVKVDYGQPSERIADVAGELDAAAVIMATHGRTGVGRLLVGSVTASVLGQTVVPLLVAHAVTATPAVSSAY